MAEDLPNVLERYRVNKTEDPVMSFYDANTGETYPVTAKGYMEIMSWYCPQVHKDEDVSMTLCEIPGEKCPVFLCYKFRLTKFDNIKLTDDLIRSLVYIARKTLRSVSGENTHCDVLCCLVSEVAARTVATDSKSMSDDITCVDIRLHFPNIVCSQKYQMERIIPRIRDGNVNLARDYGVETVDIINRSLDEIYIQRPIPLIGSTDTVGDLSYKRMMAYPTPLVDFHKELKPVPWEENLLPSENYLFGVSDIDYTILSTEETEVWAPLVASIFYSNNNIHEKFTSRTDVSSSLTNVGRGPVQSLHTSTNFARDKLLKDDDPMDLIEKFIPMIKPQRFVDIFDWKVIGEAIYNSCDGSEYGLELWIEYTEKAIKKLEGCIPKPFSEESADVLCNNEWHSFKFEFNTVRNVGFIARDDNPEAYNKWHMSWCRPAFELAVSGLDFDIAVALWRYYWLDFMSTVVGRNSVVWYRFERHRLREIPNGYSLRILISTDFAECFRKMLLQIASENASRPRGDNKIDEADEIAKNVSNLVVNLKLRRTKNNIMAEAADLFMVRDLGAKMDTNPDLLGAPNGVFVLTDFALTFRKGRPEDYVTRSTGCRYNERYTWDHKQVKEVLDWIMKVHCHDEESNDYFWLHQAAMLRGVNRSKKVFSYTGEKANNSKSSVERVMECTWGDYCDKMPASKLNSNFENAEGASPVMAALTATRVIFIDEPPRSKPLRTDTIKMMTSDSFRSRKLHENGGKNRPLFVLIFVCNFNPEFDEKSKAMRNRWVVILFDAVWSDDPEELKKPNVYPIDHNFDDKAPKFAPVWLWICAQHYAEAAEKGLRNLPKRVREATEQYWKEKDPFYLYLEDCTESVEEETMSVSFTDLYEHFVGWYRSHAPGKRIPDQIEFSCEIYQRPGWGRPNAGGIWTRKRIKPSALAKSNIGSVSGFGDPMMGGGFQGVMPNNGFQEMMGNGYNNSFIGMDQNMGGFASSFIQQFSGITA